MRDESNLIEQGLSSECVYDGVLLHVYKDEVRLPNGSNAVREVILHGGASCVLPIDDNGNVYMVRQYRYPFKRTLLEVPAGKLDKGEDPKVAAVRELQEEIGMQAEEVHYLGEFLPVVAYATEIIHMYVAKKLIKTAQNLDEDEFVDVEVFPFDTIYDMVLSGEIKDGKTIAVVLKAKAMGF